MDLTDKGQETDNLEQKIDEMVYELYGIDTEGKNLIEQDLSSYKNHKSLSKAKSALLYMHF